jgi:hypothetical protein
MVIGKSVIGHCLHDDECILRQSNLVLVCYHTLILDAVLPPPGMASPPSRAARGYVLVRPKVER